MLLINKGSLVEWMEFSLFQEFSFLRHGVVLRGREALEDPASTALLPNILRKVCGPYPFIRGVQVHGNRVEEAVSLEREGACDGLVTREKGISLLVTHADCQAAIFFDPVSHAIGCVHAGWRGQVQNIYKTTVQKMGHLYGSKASSLLVAISPSLGPCCAEFLYHSREFPPSFTAFQVKPFHFDLWGIARFQLENAGVLSHHIEIARECTGCNPDYFFSHRKRKETGRNITAVSLHQFGRS